jgi:hypothetical protein
MNKHPLGLAEGATENAATDRHREEGQIPQSREPHGLQGCAEFASLEQA